MKMIINSIKWSRQKNYTRPVLSKKSGGWMGGWANGWMGVKAVLKIAYSNQKFLLNVMLFLFSESKVTYQGDMCVAEKPQQLLLFI